MRKYLLFLCLSILISSNLTALEFEGNIQTKLSKNKTLYDENYWEQNLAQNSTFIFKNYLININNAVSIYDSLLAKPETYSKIQIFKPFDYLNSSIYADYKNRNNDMQDFTSVGIKIFYDGQRSRSIFEIGLSGNNYNYFANKNFSHYNFATYFIYKKFLKTLALNLSINLATRNFYDSKIENTNLINLISNNYISLPIKNNIGLKTGFLINTNLKSDTSCTLYEFTESFDKFAYNNYELYTGLTWKKTKLLIKTKVTAAFRHYLKIATKTPYDESKGIIELKSTYDLTKKIDLIGSVSFEVARANSDYEIAHIFTLSSKYKF